MDTWIYWLKVHSLLLVKVCKVGKWDYYSYFRLLSIIIHRLL
jgi:hypothetical protein